MRHQILDELPGEHRMRRVSLELREHARGMRRNATEAEDMFWQAVRDAQVAGFRFRRQHAVATFVLDFYCPSRRLAVEIDGGVHNDPDVAEHDRLREDQLRAAGCRIVRFTNGEVLSDLPGVLARLKAALRA